MENKKISEKSRIVFVNDGSKDKTWEIIEKLYNQNTYFSGIKLSRNRGHQNALLAGLLMAKNHADFVISLDADLQDDINAIDKMIDKYYVGAEIVYGVRSSRQTDTFFKRFTAESYYKLMQALGANMVFNHADYRLMSKKALLQLNEFKEVNLFLRGIIPMIGYRTDVVYYERAERFAGESKYPLKKMLSFAFEGITFMIIPLSVRMASIPRYLVCVLLYSISFIDCIVDIKRDNKIILSIMLIILETILLLAWFSGLHFVI